MMSKIKYYLLSNTKIETNQQIYDEKTTEVELKSLVQECGFFDNDDESEEENDIFDGGDESELLEIPVHDVRVLIINDIVDLNNSVFTGEIEDCDDNSDNSDSDTGEGKEFDFEIIAAILAPANM